MKFEPKTLDFELSPYTGMTRESFIEAGIYILEGVFNNLSSIDAPVVMPRKETEVTYPHKNASPERLDQQKRAEIFEGLTRSFFIASVVIHERPDLVINGISVREYYKKHVLRVVDANDELFVGSYKTLQQTTKSDNPFNIYQQTVETCALVICLDMCHEEIWDTYTKEEKDLIADFLTDFAHTNTVPQNWRLFNMLDMAFLAKNGYPIDRDIMRDHAQAIVNYYVGDGWYRDGQCFDYYSCWAFQMYAPLWNVWYGYEKEPLIARRIEENSNALMKTYPDMFDRDGFTNMWGRSCIYRNAATSAFEGNFFLKNPTANPGLSRRIAAGSMLQFLGRDDFLYKGVPTLGFYGQFTPLVQGYSCAESPFWFGKAFLCLHLPKDHPFWTAKEEGGTWDTLKKDQVKTTTLPGPALCFSNHGGNGETILRSGKVRKAKDDLHGMWNYGKLSYNSKFPWESTPLLSDDELSTGDVESEMYVIKDITTHRALNGNVVFYAQEKENVLYRRQIFDFDMETENHWNQAITLADTPMPLGILRVDRLKLHRRPVDITLGSYGFPDNGTKIEMFEEGTAKAIVLSGKDHMGNVRKLAMTTFYGFDKLCYTSSQGTNPDSEKSIVLYGVSHQKRQYDGSEPYVLISQVITLTEEREFTKEELFPISKVSFEDAGNVGAYGNVAISLKSGQNLVINYDAVEGNLVL